MAASTPRRPVERPYLDHGDGPPVVLVHASNMDHRIWIQPAHHMGQRYRVLAPTQRYFGTSPWPDDGRSFSLDSHAHDLAEFIGGFRLGSVALVGWSYGAAVCLLMAVEQPQLVHRLVLYEPAIVSFVHASEAAEAAAADRLDMTAQARARIGAGDASAAVKLFMDGVNDRPGTYDNLPDDVREIMLDNSRTLRLLFAAPPPALSCADFERLEGTTVVVARGDSTRVFYRIAAEWTAKCVPASTLVVVSNARHLLPVEDQERFASLILDLLTSAPTP
jgi:pimeloyl-ACP methyl ester carboxylesterase